MNGAAQAGQRAAAEVITATDDCCQACQRNDTGSDECMGGRGVQWRMVQ